MFAIAIGNPVDGMRFIGPFEDHDSAVAYAEKHCEDWLIIDLETPETDA